ncbi:MAG: polysaccharide biosynthesis tyrosine autokinase [bacterium]|nr:polysaccharide biosynthesis tyrosine autokinase [bacterium]
MPNVARAEGERGEEKLHFLDYWRVIKKRREIIIATLVIIVFTTVAFSWISPEVFSASSRIKIEQRQRPLDVFEREVRVSTAFDPFEYETHRESLNSDPVLEKVVNGEIYSSKSLWVCPQHPQVKLTEAQASDQARLCAAPGCGRPLRAERVKKYPDWIPLTQKWAKDAGLQRPLTLHEAVGRLKSNLRIRPEKGTRLITIRYESQKPKEAQLVADMVAEAYIQWMEERYEQTLQSALSKLQGAKTDYRRDLNALRADLVKKRLKFSLDSQDQPIQYGRSELLQGKRDLVRADIAQLNALVSYLSGLTDEERVAATQDNPIIYNLTYELSRCEAILNGLLEQYGPRLPDVLAQQQTINSLKNQLRISANSVLEGKKAQLDSLRAQDKELQGFVEALDKEIRESQQALEEYETAKREADQKEVVSLEMEKTQMQEQIRNTLPREDVSIVQWARLPESPVKPRKIFNVIISIFVGLTLGTGLAYFVDYVDTSIKNVDDLERYLGMSAMAVIPQQREGLLIHETPKSHAAENYRTLWTSLQFERQEDGFKSIMVTSGGVGEGKTTTVVNLGIAAAQMDTKVLLVDSDLRRPKIHKLLKYANRVGLSDVLLKDVDPTEVIVQTDVPGLSVLPSGKLPSNVIGLLSSQKMRNVVDKLSKNYDVVLYDSPPVIGVSDASVLANVVNRVLLVIDYRKYPKRFANRARKMLESVGGKVLGVIINNMKITEEDYYYYGYGRAYRYYYKRYDDKEEGEEPKPPVASAEQEQAPADSSTEAKS